MSIRVSLLSGKQYCIEYGEDRLRLEHEIAKYIVDKMSGVHSINSLAPSDTVLRHWSWSALVQVMACCLTAPSHCLNQCWFFISAAIHLRVISQQMHKLIIFDMTLKISNLKVQPLFPGANESTYDVIVYRHLHIWHEPECGGRLRHVLPPFTFLTSCRNGHSMILCEMLVFHGQRIENICPR